MRVAVLCTILGVGGLLRVWALGSGLPYSVGVDEPFVVNTAFRMMQTGDFNPHFFDYGGLLLYMHLGVMTARFMTGAVQGLWTSLEQVGPEHFYLWARALTAVLGTATVALVYLVGRAWGSSQALMAAALMAVMPNHVRESHFALTDVPMTFFTTLTLLLALRAGRQATLGAFAVAGAAAGFATSVKYPAGVALVMPIVAVLMTRDVRPSTIVALLAVVGAFGAAFLIGSPYAVLDMPAFLEGFARLTGMFSTRAPDMESGWLLYAKHLRLSLGWPGALLTLGGAALALVGLVKGPDRLRWALILIFPLLFVASIADRWKIFARYLLPILPFVSLLASVATIAAMRRLGASRMAPAGRIAVMVLLTVALFVPPVLQAIEFDRNHGRLGTAGQAYAWITEHVPAGSSFLIERTNVRLPSRRYPSRHVTFLTEYDYEEIHQTGAEYVVASSESYWQAFEEPELNADQYAAYRRIFDRSEELAVFSPSDEHPGPELRILKLER